MGRCQTMKSGRIQVNGPPALTNNLTGPWKLYQLRWRHGNRASDPGFEKLQTGVSNKDLPILLKSRPVGLGAVLEPSLLWAHHVI